MKFSILIPSFNRKEYLYYTLLSCENQNFTDVEFVIADDASTDGTVAMVSDFIKRDPRFRIIARSDNVGMLRNFELGLDTLNGDYILTLGSDDVLMPECLQRFQELLADSDCQLITWLQLRISILVSEIR